MELPDSVPWLPDRVDYQALNREHGRWLAALFNGAFLIGYYILRLPPDEGLPVLLGGTAFTLGALLGLAIRPGRGLIRRRQLEAVASERGVRDRHWMQVEVSRGGVLLGRDEGWVGRRKGALAFEGRTTRFEIVRGDLTHIPDGSSRELARRLTVKSERGPIDLRFLSSDTNAHTAINGPFTDWPEAERDLPGPPSLPKPRTFIDRIRMSRSQNEWTIWLHIAFGLSFLISPSGWSLIAIRLILLATGIVAEWISVTTAWQRDDINLGRLAAADAKRPVPAKNVVIETNNAGTGNPTVDAAVG